MKIGTYSNFQTLFHLINFKQGNKEEVSWMQEFKGTHKTEDGAGWKPLNEQSPGIEKEEGKNLSVLKLLFGPVIGLFYVILMPLLAIATVTVLIGGKFIGFLFGLVGKSVSFGWRPEASYLSGKEKENEKENESK
jgi:hypothetical protein